MSENIKRVGGNIINTNDDEYKRFLQMRDRVIREKELSTEIKELKEEVKKLKQHIREIYSRLN